MTTLAIAGRRGRDTTHPGRRRRPTQFGEPNRRRKPGRRPVGGTYRRRMSVSQQARRDRWARFVKRAVDNARAQKGWTVTKVLEETDIGRATLYSWLNASWKDDIQAGAVERFCDGLGLPVDDAFNLLWPGKFSRRKATEPLPMDPDLELLLRKLQDPNTPEMEKYFIRETLKQLAQRTPPASQPRTRRTP